ncbi:MAG: four helix bundle protein [Anaerolineaceae bacterium]
MKESPIFTKTYDIIIWITNHTEKFPKSERFRLAKKIEDSVYDFHTLILHAVYARHIEKEQFPPGTKLDLDYLQEADMELRKLIFYFRLSHAKGLTSMSQYEYITTQILELGSILGGWIKMIKSDTGASESRTRRFMEQ